MATIQEYYWDSGNGQYSSEPEPNFLYLPGNYTVTLYAKIGGTWQEKSKFDYIVVAETEQNLMQSEYLNYPKCYHLGFSEEHGFGWSENSGDNWIWPESGASIFEVEYNGDILKIAYDFYDNLPYIINTRDSATLTASYLDKGVHDIQTQVILPEHTGESFKYAVSHVESFAKFRAVLGETDLSSSLEVDMSLLTRSGETPVETLKNVDVDKEVVFKYSNNRIEDTQNRQLIISTNESKYQIMDIESVFKVNDKMFTAVKGGTTDYETFLSAPTVWHTRGNYSLDIASGNLITTTGTLTTGPDERTGSAYSLTSLMTLSNQAYANGTIMLWYKGTTPTISGGSVTLIDYAISGDWKLAYATGSIPQNLTVSNGSEVFDVRLYDSVITTSYLDEYKDKFENYLRSF